MTTPKIVVLGASGYIGSVVSGLLAKRPVDLRLVARRECAVLADSSAEITTMSIDISNDAALAEAVVDADVVFHLAKHSGDWRLPEEDPTATEPVNVGSMRSVVNALAIRRTGNRIPPLVVFAGACTQVGRTPNIAMDGTEPDYPVTAYDEQKLAAEDILMAASQAGVVRGVSLRLATVFGQSQLSAVQDRGVVTTMIRKALANEELTMWHDGTVVRDITFVEDVGRAFLAALDRPGGLVGRHWMIGSGRANRLCDVFRTVAAGVARVTDRPPVPVVTVKPPDAAVATDFLNVRINPIPFRSATSWSAAVPLYEGIERTVAAILRHPEPITTR